ncbi:PPK2 family polyphosphate:nucleotide phosphotransferase [Psychromicrobium silvestre]|uniref:PPK2 family polyphosphate:nucleotide phosphotransferase n=1 Tax=Psychromicrobium silvestre TaxID=1645614 RepID=A0A7Y9S6N1_9MICC|nr:polyphosphate kinase 2 family protein [Psychromicrobium silvestre]NYE95105.1 PPK2 family polyphosphate:nucleotide phosphotransferase [Psychromicrobium silvestre]
MASKHGFKKSPSGLLLAGSDFQLKQVDTASAPGFSGKKRDAEQVLSDRAGRLAVLQEQLFAESKFGGERAVLLVLQAMDTAGKGGIVSHVVGSVDPQGVQLHAFKAPTEEEKQHDFLWRIEKEVPRHGMLGVFDRSHYEDVLIHRVHGWADETELERRYQAINDFESSLVEAGTKIVKVMLHISPETQKERLSARLGDPIKHWKYSPGDLTERAFWPQYMEAYELAFQKTSTEKAPWHVIPADKKWYARLAVQELLVDAFESLDLGWPKGDFDLAEERKRLAAS